MSDLSDYLPQQVNQGPFVSSYSLPVLQSKLGQQPWKLPICSLSTPTRALTELGPLVRVNFKTPPTFLAVTADDTHRGSQAKTRLTVYRPNNIYKSVMKTIFYLKNIFNIDLSTL